MPSNTIKCPNCGTDVELDKAFSHELEEKLQKEYDVRLSENVKRIEQEREKVIEEARKKAGEELQKELKMLRDEAKEKQEKLEKLEKQEIELRKLKNDLEDKARQMELEVQRQLDEERKKIREKTEMEILEQQRLKEKEKDLQIDQLKKLLEEAQRKANQGSQQMQGEVQELDLEQTLKDCFPDDDIEPIGKGVLGADIRQVVKTPKGTVCGSILWESKRTKTWAGDWIAKLKEDVRSDKANLCAIVSTALPEEASVGFGVKDGVWVTNLPLVPPVATTLRKILLESTRQKIISQKKEDQAAELYDYITGHDFRNQVEAMVQTYQEMQGQIERERVVFEKNWKTRETQVRKLLSGVANIYGSIQGHAGPALPPVKSLELSEPEQTTLPE